MTVAFEEVFFVITWLMKQQSVWFLDNMMGWREDVSNWQVTDSTTLCLPGLWNSTDQHLAPGASAGATLEILKSPSHLPPKTCFHFKMSSCFWKVSDTINIIYSSVSYQSKSSFLEQRQSRMRKTSDTTPSETHQWSWADHKSDSEDLAWLWLSPPTFWPYLGVTAGPQLLIAHCAAAVHGNNSHLKQPPCGSPRAENTKAWRHRWGLRLRSRPVCWWAASRLWRRWRTRSGSSSDLWGFLRARGLYGAARRGAKSRPRSGECSTGQKTARAAATPARCPSMESVETLSDTCRTRVGNGMNGN